MKFVIVTVAQLLAVDRNKLNMELSVDQVIKNNLDAHADTKPAVQLNLSDAVAARIKELSSTASEAAPAPEVTDPAPVPAEPTTEATEDDAPAHSATAPEVDSAPEVTEAAPAPASADKPKRK